MIPSLIDLGPPSLWLVLPPGVHWATIDEVEATFATNQRRQDLFDGFKRAVAELQGAGCSRVYLDGSFTTSKPHPGDFDGCWDPSGVDASKLDPMFIDLISGRTAQKRRFGGELLITQIGAMPVSFLTHFQTDKESGRPKGIIGIDLSSASPQQNSSTP